MRFQSGRYTGVSQGWLSGRGHSDVAKAFGYKPGAHYPPEASAKAELDGITLILRPKTKKRMEKRVYAVCPVCSKQIEAGHLHQHAEAYHL